LETFSRLHALDLLDQIILETFLVSKQICGHLSLEEVEINMNPNGFRLGSVWGSKNKIS